MPQVGTEVAHAAITDHRVPRARASSGELASIEPSLTGRLSSAHSSLDGRDLEAQRDSAIAEIHLIDQGVIRSDGPPLLAIGLLQVAVQRDPGDLEALEALSHGRWWEGKRQESIGLMQRVLELSPRREFARYSLAVRYQELNRPDLAAETWRAALAVNPWVQRQRQGLGIALAELRQWEVAADACRSALELFPADLRSRQVLVECLLGLGRGDEADAEFETLVRFDWFRDEQLRRWYANHPLRQPATRPLR
jgi:tetratricopeptide (TPR) repeat protein